jgi:hypothetical protein
MLEEPIGLNGPEPPKAFWPWGVVGFEICIGEGVGRVGGVAFIGEVPPINKLNGSAPVYFSNEIYQFGT